MSFQEDSYLHVANGLQLRGAAVPFVYESKEFVALADDIAGNFRGSNEIGPSDERLTAFIDKVMNAEHLSMILKDAALDLETFIKSYPGETESVGRVSQFITAMSGRNADLLAFLHDRLKVYLRDQGIRHDIIDAVLAQPGNDDLVLVVNRATALNDMLQTQDGQNLTQGLKRAGNILAQAEEKDGVEYSFGADPKFAETDAERALFKALDTAEPAIRKAMASEDFPAAMSAIAALRAPIDAFFEAVQVNTDNQIIRRNRLNLLSRIREAGRQIADFTRIEG